MPFSVPSRFQQQLLSHVWVSKWREAPPPVNPPRRLYFLAALTLALCLSLLRFLALKSLLFLHLLPGILLTFPVNPHFHIGGFKVKPDDVILLRSGAQMNGFLALQQQHKLLLIELTQSRLRSFAFLHFLYSRWFSHLWRSWSVSSGLSQWFLREKAWNLRRTSASSWFNQSWREDRFSSPPPPHPLQKK